MTDLDYSTPCGIEAPIEVRPRSRREGKDGRPIYLSRPCNRPAGHEGKHQWTRATTGIIELVWADDARDPKGVSRGDD